jgi:hypothetical protein
MRNLAFERMIVAQARCGRWQLTDELERLAKLIQAKNEADQAIAELLGRPGLTGNIGEFIAARVFSIELEKAGSHPGYDGVFRGPSHLAGKTVNIKTYGRDERILDISDHHCDYYLVMTGPPGAAQHRPLVIDSVYLFDTADLLGRLRERGVKVGVATSLRRLDWDTAKIFPHQPSAPLRLSENQIASLALFRFSEEG